MGKCLRTDRLIARWWPRLRPWSWRDTGSIERGVDSALVRTEPTQIVEDSALLRRAVAIGRVQFERHCAGCHGSQLQGDQERGVPDLAANAWLYTDDPVDVEHTILYGIRSGHPKARNLTDMPAMVRSGQISADDAHDVVVRRLPAVGIVPVFAILVARHHQIQGAVDEGAAAGFPGAAIRAALASLSILRHRVDGYPAQMKRIVSADAVERHVGAARVVKS